MTALVRADRLSADRLDDAAEATRRMTLLSGISLALTSVETLHDLVEVAVRRAADVLGAAGGMLLTASEQGWEMTFSDDVGEDYAARWQFVRRDDPMAPCHVARTGETLVLPTMAAGLAFHPSMAEVYDQRPGWSWVIVPLRDHDQVVGSLSLSWSHENAVTAPDLAQTLQAAMLTEPPRPPGLDLAVRYRPAVDLAQVGGDWYDAVELPDGSVVLAIGDVCGHDHLAARRRGRCGCCCARWPTGARPTRGRRTPRPGC